MTGSSVWSALNARFGGFVGTNRNRIALLAMPAWSPRLRPPRPGKGEAVTGGHRQRQARALLGAYALDAVDQAEREQVEAHLAGCATCRRELAQLREAADMLPPASRPPEDLWKRVVAEVQAAEDQQRDQEKYGYGRTTGGTEDQTAAG